MERFSRTLSATQYLLEANSNILLSVQIETKEAFEGVDEIAAVDGIDLLFVGPFDLGNNIGFPVRDNHIAPQLEQAISKVLHAAHDAGKKAGIYCGNGQQAKHYADMGFDLVNVVTDIGALSASLDRESQIARGTSHRAAPRTYGS
jgi:4-hydroxy-2-oxoheptanedioate aldolase